MKKRNIYITTGFSFLAIVAIYIMINRNRKKKMINEINDILNRGTGATGEAADIQNDKAFDPNFWKIHSADKNLDKSTAAKSLAKKIYDAVGVLYDDEDEVVKILTKTRSKIMVSAIASAFRSLYAKDLGKFIVERIDKTDNLEQIANHIKSLSEK